MVLTPPSRTKLVQAGPFAKEDGEVVIDAAGKRVR
jgi:hypothetical protein